MKLATSTSDFGELIADTRHIGYALKYFQQTPFKHLNLEFTRVFYPESPWTDKGDLWKKEVEDCAQIAQKLGLDFVQSHAPFYPYSLYFDESTRPVYMQAIRNSIEACTMLGIPNITVHGVFENGCTPQDFFRENYRFYNEVGDTAEKYGVDILLENFEGGDYGYYFRTGREMRQFIDEVKIPRLHACWDTGHANVRGRNQYEDILELGNHLRALHVQDNWGTADSHVMPLVGTTNFDQVLRGLVEVGYQGSFCFEASDTLRVGNEFHHPRRAPLPEDRLFNPTIQLQLKVEELLYEVGRWMLESYGFCVE